MSRWRATMPKEKPEEGKADFVFAYRNNRVRFELCGKMAEKTASKLMEHVIRKSKE